MIAILDNLRSIHNTASIFRTADAVGIKEIYLCGTTPQPVDKWGREVPGFNKVSLGAEQNLKWQYFSTTAEAVEVAKKKKYQVVAIEQSENSKNIFKYNPGKKIAIMVGPEVVGINKTTLDICDTILEIPMFGKKESLNVSVAFGVAAYILKLKYDN